MQLMGPGDAARALGALARLRPVLSPAAVQVLLATLYHMLPAASHDPQVSERLAGQRCTRCNVVGVHACPMPWHPCKLHASEHGPVRRARLQVLAALLVGVVRLGLAPSSAWMARLSSYLMAALSGGAFSTRTPATHASASPSAPASALSPPRRGSPPPGMHASAGARPAGRLRPALVASLVWAYGELTPEPPYAHTRFRPPRALMQLLVGWVGGGAPSHACMAG